MMSRQRGLPHGHSLAATFPALDPNGNVQYVQARYLEPIGSDKYDNPAGSLGSNPRLAWTRTPDGRTSPGVLLVTEGIPDALRSMAVCFQAGLSLLQTFQQVASEVQGPLGTLFARAAHQLETG